MKELNLTDIKMLCVALCTVVFDGVEHLMSIILLQVDTMNWLEFTKGVLTLVGLLAAAFYGIFRAKDMYHKSKISEYEEKKIHGQKD